MLCTNAQYNYTIYKLQLTKCFEIKKEVAGVDPGEGHGG